MHYSSSSILNEQRSSSLEIQSSRIVLPNINFDDNDNDNSLFSKYDYVSSIVEIHFYTIHNHI